MIFHVYFHVIRSDLAVKPLLMNFNGISKTVTANLRILKCFKSQRREFIETTRISNTTEEPFKAVPNKTDA